MVLDVHEGDEFRSPSHHLSQAQALVRFDGQSGTGAVIADLGGFLFVMRGKDYTVLDHPRRVVTVRLNILLRQVSLKPPPNRTYAFPHIRLSNFS